ncbi:MAG: PhoH family protein, partial [Ilumatobacteraceae bacterium]
MTSFTRVYSVIVPGAHLTPALLGQRDVNLRIIEQAFPAATIVVRGNEITIDGPQAELVSRRFEELIVLLQGGHHLDEGSLQRSIAMMHDNERPSAVLTDDIMRGAKGKPVRPKSAGQKRYIDAIRNNVITFGLGPAGTGKSWLAVAMAVQALQTKQVQRIILTRPAVEAGERLGFLP